MVDRDEAALREGFRVLDTLVAPARPDLADVVLGRLARRRARRTTLRVAVTSLAVGLVVTVAGTAPSENAEDVATSPVLAWRAFRDPALDGESQRAVAAWQGAGGGMLRPGESLRWLYSARVPGTEEVAVAFATCVAEHCDRVVIAHADRRDLANPGIEDDEAWVVTTQHLSGSTDPVLAAFLDGPGVNDRGPTNVILVVAPPATARVTYTAGGRTHDLPRAGGAFAGNVGYLDARVSVTALDADGRVVAAAPVGGAGDSGVPNVRWVPLPEVPRRYRVIGLSRGQMRDPFLYSRNRPATRKHFVVFARCEGQFEMGFTVLGETHLLRCDGRTRRLIAEKVIPAEGIAFSMGSNDPFTVYSVAIAER